jgi:hypothetical protein
MKIGIITYHWAYNYGAVMQAYALQTYLEKRGHIVEFINYVPINQKAGLLRKYIGRNIKSTKLKWKTAQREKNFHTFVSKLNVSSIKYTSYQELLDLPPKYDIYICGSDQVWNYDLVSSTPEKKGISHPYYLDFGDETTIRVAYAPSFGAVNIPDDLKDEVKKCLSKFNSISVREKSGVEIVKSLGFKNVKWMPDPTFLLNKEDYLNIETSVRNDNQEFIYSYILEEQDEMAKKVLTLLSDKNKKIIYNVFMGTIIKDKNYKNIIPSPEQWLHCINNADFIVTNSFHSTVFALIFHRPFITIPLGGIASGRNERIISLLDSLGLSVRLLWEYDENVILKIRQHSINWEIVDEKINKWQENADDYFLNAFKMTFNL